MLQGRLDDYQVLRSGNPAAILMAAVFMGICVIAAPFGGPLSDDRWAALAVDPEDPHGRSSAPGQSVVPPGPVFGRDTPGPKAGPDRGAIARFLAAGEAVFGAVPTTAMAGIGLRLCGSDPAGGAASLGTCRLTPVVGTFPPAEGW